MATKILCSFRNAKGNSEKLFGLHDEQTRADEAFIHNLYTVNSPAMLMRLSSEIQKKEQKYFANNSFEKQTNL